MTDTCKTCGDPVTEHIHGTVCGERAPERVDDGPAFRCVVCDDFAGFSWTDTHGVAQCRLCGAPYRILHYDEAGKRIAKGPEIAVMDWAVPALREYRQTTKRVAPSGHSFNGSDQEIATTDDAIAFAQWFNDNRSRFEPDAMLAERSKPR